VVGISARITNNIVIKLSPQSEFDFFIEFLLSTGTQFGQRNTSTKDFIERAILAGATREQANGQIGQIVKGLIFGTAQQQYAAAAGLASIYGYGLAPIEQQNGDPLFVPQPE
jgi:hypothetical protein